jgi:hypothetical protein
VIKQGLLSFLFLPTLVGMALAQSPTPTPAPTVKECTVPFVKEIDTNARVLAKPEPKFSRRDRELYKNHVITLRATFCGSGQVTDISVTSGASATTDVAAIEAAKLIRFTPAEKDGKKVSREMILKYFVKD